MGETRVHNKHAKTAPPGRLLADWAKFVCEELERRCG